MNSAGTGTVDGSAVAVGLDVAVGDAQLRRAHASATARRGLDVNAARMLHLVLTDQLGDKRRLNIRDQQALVQLRNGALLVESAPESHLTRQQLAVAPDVTYSLRAPAAAAIEATRAATGFREPE